MNCSTFINQSTWGVHVNFDGHFASPTTSPAWLTPLQQRDWQCRGIVVWDAGVRVIAHLHAGYALELLEQMRANDAWQSNGFLIGSPTYQLSSETVDGISTLENQIELASDRARYSSGFLSAHKKSLEYLAIRDNEEAEDVLRTVFRLIATTAEKFEKVRRMMNQLRSQKRTSSLLSSHVATTLPFIKPLRSVTSHPNRSEPGSE